MDVYNCKKHKIDSSWLITIKKDGVQVIYKDGVPRSRADKPLYNLPTMPDGTYECFMGSVGASVSAVRTINGQPISRDCLYRLDTEAIDERLVINGHARALGYHVYSATDIAFFFEAATIAGHEGLVLHGPSGQLLKLKGKETHDVTITGVMVGNGKYATSLGKLVTKMGKVGTGFSNAQRDWFWQHRKLIEWKHAAYCLVFHSPEFFLSRKLICDCELEGYVIEVECMSVTEDGKFRHPRFVRSRPDKQATNENL